MVRLAAEVGDAAALHRARGYTEMAERLAELVPAGRMEEAVDAFRAVAEAAGRASRS